MYEREKEQIWMLMIEALCLQGGKLSVDSIQSL